MQSDFVDIDPLKHKIRQLEKEPIKYNVKVVHSPTVYNEINLQNYNAQNEVAAAEPL